MLSGNLDESGMKDEFVSALNRDLTLERTVHLLLHYSSIIYGFNQVAYLNLKDMGNDYVAATIVDGFGPVNDEEHQELQQKLAGMTPQELYALINEPPAGHNPEFLEPIKGDTFNIDLTVDSILSRAVKGTSYWNTIPPEQFTEQGKNISEKFGTDEFAVIAVKERKEDHAIGIIYGNKKFSDEPFSSDKEKIRMYIETAAVVLQLFKRCEDEVEYRVKETIYDLVRRLVHEIRNPLVAIGGYAKSISSNFKGKKRAISNATIIAEEISRLEGILRDMSFSREIKLEPSHFNIYDLTEETLSKYTLEGETGSRYDNQRPDFHEKMEVYADKNKTIQVLLNIIKNAFEAMSSDLGRDAEENTLSVRYRYRDGMREVLISNPQFIEPDIWKRMFEPYFTTKKDGTGVGLDISRDIAQKSNGYLMCESNKKTGTTLILGLPCGY